MFKSVLKNVILVLNIKVFIIFWVNMIILRIWFMKKNVLYSVIVIVKRRGGIRYRYLYLLFFGILYRFWWMLK